MGSTQVLYAFATFMADYLIGIGALPAPQNQEEAGFLIEKVIERFDEFLLLMEGSRPKSSVLPNMN